MVRTLSCQLARPLFLNLNIHKIPLLIKSIISPFGARYMNKFTSNDVDMEALMKLTPGDLTEIGIPVGPRRKLLDALEKRKEVLNKPQRISDTYL